MNMDLLCVLQQEEEQWLGDILGESVDKMQLTRRILDLKQVRVEKRQKQHRMPTILIVSTPLLRFPAGRTATQKPPRGDQPLGPEAGETGESGQQDDLQQEEAHQQNVHFQNAALHAAAKA